MRFVENIREGGSTNIDGALKAALGMIHDDSRPSYVLFLTDGLPTAGETKETAIADNCRTANRNRARLFAFGVGYDVNARLLDRLSGGNSGTSEYVKPDEDIETPRRPVLRQDDQPRPLRHPGRARRAPTSTAPIRATSPTSSRAASSSSPVATASRARRPCGSRARSAASAGRSSSPPSSPRRTAAGRTTSSRSSGRRGGSAT